MHLLTANGALAAKLLVNVGDTLLVVQILLAATSSIHKDLPVETHLQANGATPQGEVALHAQEQRVARVGFPLDLTEGVDDLG
jgi:hypothetical protein